MNQVTTMYQDGEQKKSIHDVAISGGRSGSKIAPQSLGEVVRFSELMAKADIALPPHLRGNVGACMAVAMQALEWQMSPFAVASKSYAVKGAIAYEAQLIAAVVNTRSGIKGRLKYAYEGQGQDLVCTVTGTIDGETLDYESPRLGDIKVQNSPLWKGDPRQQLGYFSARSWARRHTPEVLLGVYDRDEAQQFQGPDNARDVTPQTTLAKQIAERKAEPKEGPQEPQEGFSASFVQEQTEAIQNEPQPEPEPIEETPQSLPSDTEPGSAEPEQLFPHKVAQELIASLKALENEKQISNTWHLQFEKRAEQMDEYDRQALAQIAGAFSDFVQEKCTRVALDNLCEDVLAEIFERNDQPAL